MTLAENRDKLIGNLRCFDDPQERLAYLVDVAKQRPGLPDEFKTEDHKIQGCLSNLWFVPEFRDGRCFYSSDGDSVIVRAIAGLLCDFYSGHAPEEILRQDPGFLAGAGITQHLSQNRKNGLGRLWQKIAGFAAEHALVADPASPR